MVSSLEILCLCENSVYTPELYGEHGFSCLLKIDNHFLLFDTGQGLSLKHNALKLKADLHKVESVVLSHGHFDHCGGVQTVLTEKNYNNGSPLNIYVHPEFFTPKYHLRKEENKDPLYIGPPFTREELLQQGAHVKTNNAPLKILEGVFLSGSIPLTAPPETSDDNLVKEVDSDFIVDNFAEEQSLILPTRAGLVIISGCTHSGLENTLKHAVDITGVSQVHLLAGGLHLFKSPHLLPDVKNLFKAYQVEHLAVSHCTGLEASFYLKNHWKENFYYLNVGDSLNFAF